MPCAFLPERQRLCGPVTAQKIKRLGLVYSAIFLLGLGLSQGAQALSWQVFGLGLMLPGGGFLAYANGVDGDGLVHLALAIGAMGLFGAAALLWFATGNALAPPLSWLLAALAGAFMDPGLAYFGAVCGSLRLDARRLVPLLVLGGIAFMLLVAVVKRQRAGTQRRAANAYLVTSAREIARGFRQADDALAPEFSLADLQRMRFLLDRALQPVGSFNGFEWLDQFQTAAVRYQLNFMGYALSMAQATRLPAFGGYLHEAQRRLIAKQTDHRIWGYWALENRWGNLQNDPDPVARENIMYTGFCATQIALFHASANQRDFERPGSFSLQHPQGQCFSYDFPALVDSLDCAFKVSDFYLMACEPNWIYPLCNSIGAAAVKARDTQVGDTRWASHQALFRQHLEGEFIDLAGRFVPCRSTYTGVALPVIGGAMPQAMPCFFLNATLPDVALRQWLLLRRQLLTRSAIGPALKRRQFWPIDTGNYQFSRAAAYAGTALAAVEMGDHEVSSLCLAALEEECPTVTAHGIAYRPKASVWAHAVEFLARSGVVNGFRHLIETPSGTTPQPMISEVPYPEVLVARAVSQHGALTAVLYPGDQHGLYRVALFGLQPGRAYACVGIREAGLVADAHGAAAVHVALAGRLEIHVQPAP